VTALDLPLLAVGTILTVLLFAFGVRRLLGLRLSTLRTLAAGLIAFAVASPIITTIGRSAVTTKKPAAFPAVLFVILGVATALLVGMVVLVIAEALVPSGSVPGPVYMLRGLPMLRRLPRRVDRIAGALEAGRLSVSVRLLADPADRRYLTGLLHQVILAILAATSGVMAVLLGLHGGPSVTRTVTLYTFFGYCLLVIAAIFAVRVLVLVFHQDTR
jgi:hypothetical protein